MWEIKKLTLADIIECLLFSYCHLCKWALVELRRGHDRWREVVGACADLRQLLATVDVLCVAGSAQEILRLVNGENFLLPLCKLLL